MRRERDQRDHAGQDRVPVEDSIVCAGHSLVDSEVGPERFEEIPIGTERNAAHHVAQRCAEEDAQAVRLRREKITSKNPRQTGCSICDRKFDADAAQH